MKYIIAGNGPAGVIASETLRKVDPRANILLVGDEPEPPYSRMAIPYLLSGGIDEAGTHLRKAKDHYQGLKIRILRDRITRVSAKKHEVTLDGGKTESFDRLLIATGASAVKPPVDGLDLPGVHHCWTLEDARNIARLAEKGSPVVLMGAGFIGCIILESLISRGVKLTVVEMEDRMAPKMMNDTAAALLKSWCQDKGVPVKTGTSVSKVAAIRGSTGMLALK